MGDPVVKADGFIRIICVLEQSTVFMDFPHSIKKAGLGFYDQCKIKMNSIEWLKIND